MAYPYRIVLKALATWFLEIERWRRAARALGHRTATIVEPQGLAEQLDAVERGQANTIGTSSAAFRVVGDDGHPLAYCYLEADKDGFRIEMNPDEAFARALRDVTGTTH